MIVFSQGIRHLVSGFGQWFLLLEVAESGAVNQLRAAEASPGGVAARRWQPSTPMGVFATLEDRKGWDAKCEVGCFLKACFKVRVEMQILPTVSQHDPRGRQKRWGSILGILGSCSRSCWYLNCLICFDLHAWQTSKEVRLLQHQVLSQDQATIKLGIHEKSRFTNNIHIASAQNGLESVFTFKVIELYWYSVRRIGTAIL